MRALFPPAAQTHDKGHGRREWRAIWVCPTDPWSTNFAGACQLLRIERHIWEGQAEKPRIEVVYGVTSLEATQGPPERLLALIRQHWGAIENGHHHRRDRTYREDNSPVRDPNATPSYAALRAVAIFLAGQHKRAQKCPQTYPLPDFHRDVRFAINRAIGWFTQAYVPP